jgi:dGTPase
LTDVGRHALIRGLVGLLVDDLIATTEAALALAQPATPEDIRRMPHNLASFSPEIAAQVAELKRYLYAHMYGSWRIVRMQRRAERFLTALVETFTMDPRQLPPGATGAIERVGLPRAVADTVASMTDKGALLEYRRLFDPATSP